MNTVECINDDKPTNSQKKIVYVMINDTEAAKTQR